MTEKTNYILRSIQESMMAQREKWEELQLLYTGNCVLYRLCQSRMDQLDEECEQIRSVFIMAER